MTPAMLSRGLKNSAALLPDVLESIARGQRARGPGRMHHLKSACIVILFCAATTYAKTQVHCTKLLDFTGPNGYYPNALVQGTDGNLYGSTFGSIIGPPGHHTFSGGTIFRMTPAGQQTVLYTFCAQANCPDGDGPSSHMVLATDKNFYGTTSYGGAHSSPSVFGGTFFKVTKGGALTTLYSFCALANCADGSYPGQLIQGADGNFYGTTIQGGANASGTVFKITPRGTLTTLYSFCSLTNCADGSNAHDGGVAVGLFQATDGSFYGTTAGGGANGGGTVFKITPQGTLTTLYSFCSQANCADGDGPLGGVTQATDGNFYGTTYAGGSAPVNYGGTVFKITPEGKLTSLHTFCTQTGCPDGYYPATVPIQGTDGNLYGTTAGTDFNISTAGTFQTLHNIPNTYANPNTTLVQATNGIFYGTTPQGGGAGLGTAYNMAVVGLGPFVEAVQSSGKVGRIIMILGQGFIGTTGVFFNGKSASYTVASDTYLKATIPIGATTGPITVATPGGRLTSNKPFVVAP